MKIRKLLALGIAAALAVGTLTACGGGGNAADDAADAAQDVADDAADAAQGAADAVADAADAAADAVEGAIDLSGYDFSSPDIEVGFGSFEVMDAQASAIQNGEYEDMILTIDGVVIHPGSSYAIGEANEDGSQRIGTQFIIVDGTDADYPADGAHVRLTGVVTIINEDYHVWGIATTTSMIEVLD